MYRKTSDYLIYLIGLASVAAAGVANAVPVTDQQSTLMKLDNIKQAGGWFQTPTWINKAFPESTGRPPHIPPQGLRASPPGSDTQSGKAAPGAMKKKLKTIQHKSGAN